MLMGPRGAAVLCCARAIMLWAVITSICAAQFVVLLRSSTAGVWFWLVGGLFLVAGNWSVVDVRIEISRSRSKRDEDVHVSQCN